MGGSDAIAEARRRLHASFEAIVQDADQTLAANVAAGDTPVAVLATWEQWKASERARRRLPAPGGDLLDLLDF